MKYYKTNDSSDWEDYLYRVNGKKVERYSNGKWIDSYCSEEYLKSGRCYEISEKEAFIEALSQPDEYEEDWDGIWGKWTIAAADSLREQIDRDIIQELINKVDKEMKE